ncbi:hypothetical protein BDU57DRAFT_543574 [Ampelomyces quisqualis]|uniref:Uncharacterized protein n=1 Tax=Ampelomyces quisqualis TaxID=50730 RepID=A0A6A5Q6H1_AMPQU|nr:hypothetical protein BDU57DRAFT_543574 [Ampelomyces quisqualis]
MPYLRTRIKYLRSAAKRKGGELENRYLTVAIQPPPDDKLDEVDHGDNKYMYKFRPLPPQSDPVLHLMKTITRELNRNNMAFAAAHVRIHASTPAPPFWPIDPARPYYDAKLYTFIMNEYLESFEARYYREFPITAAVCVHTTIGCLDKDAVYIKIGNDWQHFRKWLLSKCHPKQALGVCAQRMWWKLNGKKFRLLDLPAELRVMIFERVLGPRVYPLSTIPGYNDRDSNAHQNATVCWGLGFYTADARRRQRIPGWLWGGHPHTIAGPSVSQPNLAILQLNKQIHAEALRAGWEGSCKCFFSPRQFQSVIEARHPMPNYDWLSKVVLDFTMEGWFEFFGIKTFEYFHLDLSESHGAMLRGIPMVKSLELLFRSPDDGWHFGPWSPGWGASGPYTCCQRVMVDWIMTVAWPYVKHLPKVMVGGAVKRDSETKWNNLLALALKDKDAVFDHARNEWAIFNTPPTHLPPPCSCRTPCTVEHASRTGLVYRHTDTFDHEDD